MRGGRTPPRNASEESEEGRVCVSCSHFALYVVNPFILEKFEARCEMKRRSQAATRCKFSPAQLDS